MDSIEQMIPEVGEAHGAGLPRTSRRGTASAVEAAHVHEAIVRLQDLEGRRLLLVNWSTTCGFCEAIVEDLAKLQPALEKRGVDVVLA